MAGETELMDYDEDKIRYEEEWELDEGVHALLDDQRKRESSACSEKVKANNRTMQIWPIYRSREHVPSRRTGMNSANVLIRHRNSLAR